MQRTLEAPQAASQALPQSAPPQPAPPQPAQSQSISVDIYDQIYNLRGTDPAYIERLAAMVDAKMRAVSALGNTVDSLRVAVLAALNIADELATARQRHDQIANLAGSLESSQHSTRTRASNLAHMLDEVLEDRKVG
jgi:cell division protein ZapA